MDPIDVIVILKLCEPWSLYSFLDF